MRQREGQLRAVILILMVVVATIIIASALFIANNTLGIIGALATLLFGLFSVYHHYFELPEGVSDSVHESEIDESLTAGQRPKPTDMGFDINLDDFVLSQLPPKRVAQIIYNSPDWQQDGHGGHSIWWRPRLRRLFHSDIFSNRVFEITLLGLTMGSFVLLYFVLISFIPNELSLSFFEPLTEVYPSNQPIERTQLIVVLSAVIGLVGTVYFEIKSESSCPVCNSPFALESKKRHFKPKNREVITTSTNGISEKVEVTYGVHIFHCQSCGSWIVKSDKWERGLDSQQF